MELIWGLVFVISFFIIVKYIIIILGYIGVRVFSKIKTKEVKDKGYTDNTRNSTDTRIFKVKSDNFKKIILGYTRYCGLFTGRIPSHIIRKWLYKKAFLIQFEDYKSTVIHGGCEIRDGYNLYIGKGTIIGDSCILDARNKIVIGKNVNFSTGVWIWTDQHDINDENFECTTIRKKEVIINNRVWLGARTIILPGITLGEGSVIASGAVVTKDTEPFGIYVGIPARKIGERNHNISYEFDGSTIGFY